MASAGWFSGIGHWWLGRFGAPAIARPTANFTGTPTTGSAPLTVAYTDTSTGVITSRQFDPGDGSGIQTSVPAHHTYVSVGSYSPSLTVTGPGGSNTLTRTNYITVTVPTIDPWTINWTWEDVAAVNLFWEDTPAVNLFWEDVAAVQWTWDNE